MDVVVYRTPCGDAIMISSAHVQELSCGRGRGLCVCVCVCVEGASCGRRMAVLQPCVHGPEASVTPPQLAEHF